MSDELVVVEDDGPEWNPCPVTIVLKSREMFRVPNNEAWTYTQNGVWAIGYFISDVGQTKRTVEFYHDSIKYVEYDVERMHEGYVNQLNEQLEMPDERAA